MHAGRIGTVPLGAIVAMLPTTASGHGAALRVQGSVEAVRSHP
jgi:hypothetical protein